MQKNPDFYLVCADDYGPLLEPRSCWITNRLRITRDVEYVIVEISPPLRESLSSDDAGICSVLLSPCRSGESLATITSWPMGVNVSRIVDGPHIVDVDHSRAQIRSEVLCWARIYPSIELATEDKRMIPRAQSQQTMEVPQILFLGEQDGIPEQLLKKRLAAIFETDHRICRAFLARVNYGEKSQNTVALCLSGVREPDHEMLDKVGDAFTSLGFSNPDSLDVMFINTEQEKALSELCEPFYVQVACSLQNQASDIDPHRNCTGSWWIRMLRWLGSAR